MPLLLDPHSPPENPNFVFKPESWERTPAECALHLHESAAQHLRNLLTVGVVSGLIWVANPGWEWLGGLGVMGALLTLVMTEMWWKERRRAIMASLFVELSRRSAQVYVPARDLHRAYHRNTLRGRLLHLINKEAGD